SVPGGGTSIELWLPAMATDVNAEDSSSSVVTPLPAQQEGAATLPPVGDGRLILVVDDETGVRSVTSGFLRRAGYEVLEASSGAEALAMVEGRPEISLVVMDVMMPGMNGDEAARRIHV
ncbi:response regulator, partial [Acetobacter tropicalis]